MPPSRRVDVGIDSGCSCQGDYGGLEDASLLGGHGGATSVQYFLLYTEREHSIGKLCRTKLSTTSIFIWLSLRRGLSGVRAISQLRERNANPALLLKQPDPLLKKLRQGHGFAEDHQQVVTVHHEERGRFPPRDRVLCLAADIVKRDEQAPGESRFALDFPPGKPANRLQAKGPSPISIPLNKRGCRKRKIRRSARQPP